MDEKEKEPNGQTQEAQTEQETQEEELKVVGLESGPKEEESSSNEDANKQDVKDEEWWKSQAAYLRAEVENMRKRFEREKADFVRYANEDLLSKVLPVLDNLNLAINSVQDSRNETKDKHPLMDGLLKGVEMTLKQFEQVLEQAGVEFLPSKGEAFDPGIHEAVGQSADSEFGDNVVTGEFQRGFKLRGRVIRPAKVVVNRLDDAQDKASNKKEESEAK